MHTYSLASEKLIPKYLVLEMRIMTISVVPPGYSTSGIRRSNVGSIECVKGTPLVKRGFAHMQKHGVIMDVTNAEQARLAEEAGAVAVMVLDKLPFDVRRAGGVARTASIKVIESVIDSVSIPIMAKCRIGHTSEALILQESGVDMIDESEVLTPADEERHIWKWDYSTPFVNGARNLGEALRRTEEGASMIRTKGEPGTGDVAEAVTHVRNMNNAIRMLRSIFEDGDFQQLIKMARDFKTSYELILETAKLGRLPVVNFAAGGISTPADAAMLMQLGCDGIFVGSGIFIAEDPLERAKAIVLSTTYFDDPKVVLEAQKMIDEKKSMIGLDTKNLAIKMQERGPAI
jgi:pyridoxal 5'-phosphate synthase pdxS subunit